MATPAQAQSGSSSPSLGARERSTGFCRRYGLRVPILQAPMAGACPAGLAISVANAGGMGGFGALTTSPDGNDTVLAKSPTAQHLEYAHIRALGGVCGAPAKILPTPAGETKPFAATPTICKRGVSGRARRTHSHERTKTGCDHVYRSGAVAMPPLLGGRRALGARRAGRRDFIRKQLPDSHAYTLRAGRRSANYLST
jgi:hypothetical protein